MNFIQRKKNSSFLVPSYPSLSFHRYKSFLTRFSLGCAGIFGLMFSERKFEELSRGEEDRGGIDHSTMDYLFAASTFHKF